MGDNNDLDMQTYTLMLTLESTMTQTWRPHPAINAIIQEMKGKADIHVNVWQLNKMIQTKDPAWNLMLTLYKCAASNDVQVNVDIIGENIDPDKEPYPKSDTHQTNKWQSSHSNARLRARASARRSTTRARANVRLLNSWCLRTKVTCVWMEKTMTQTIKPAHSLMQTR